MLQCVINQTSPMSFEKKNKTNVYSYNNNKNKVNIYLTNIFADIVLQGIL